MVPEQETGGFEVKVRLKIKIEIKVEGPFWVQVTWVPL